MQSDIPSCYLGLSLSITFLESIHLSISLQFIAQCRRVEIVKLALQQTHTAAMEVAVSLQIAYCFYRTYFPPFFPIILD